MVIMSLSMLLIEERQSILSIGTCERRLSDSEWDAYAYQHGIL